MSDNVGRRHLRQHESNISAATHGIPLTITKTIHADS